MSKPSLLTRGKTRSQSRNLDSQEPSPQPPSPSRPTAKHSKPGSKSTKIPKKQISQEWCPCRTGSTVDQKHWIQCTFCDQWWHIECLGLTEGESEQYTKEESSYRCPICQIGALQANACIIGAVQTAVTNKTLNTGGASSIVCAASSAPQKTLPKVQEPKQDTNNTGGVISAGEHVVILDNITPQHKYKKSAEIKKEISSQKPDLDFKFANPLPAGGIAIHCNSAESEKSALSDWPSSAFDSPHLKAHKPAGAQPNKTVVVKSINPKYSEQFIASEISDTPGQVQVRRYWSNRTRAPIPVVSITFSTAAKANDAITRGIKIDNKEYTCEAKRAFKIVRCLNCQSFGHQAATCINTSKCHRCAQNHLHPQMLCTATPLCANCGGSHASYSNKCPVFCSYYSRLKARHIIQHENSAAELSEPKH